MPLRGMRGRGLIRRLRIRRLQRWLGCFGRFSRDKDLREIRRLAVGGFGVCVNSGEMRPGVGVGARVETVKAREARCPSSPGQAKGRAVQPESMMKICSGWVSNLGRCNRLTCRRAEVLRRSFMLKKKHKLGVAAVLAGAALFSPLLCGMTCLETRVERASAAVEAAAPSEELMGELAKSEVVGCVLTHMV